MLSLLRQPRYLGLSALMVVLAIVCSAAGTWQIFRFEQKHNANHHLRSDAHDPPAPVAAALGPARRPSSDGQAQKYRVVTATGSYLAGAQTLLRGQSTDGSNVGYYVLTPLRTTDGVLLIARGFIVQTNAASSSPTVPAPPTGAVSVSARLEPGSTAKDKYGRLPGSQVDTVNAAEQAARIGAPVWNAYAELLPGQPGGSGLQAIPAPDLSNPAGGAEEPQHLAYVLQWYLFALLALAAPFVMARAELRREGQAAGPAGPDRSDRTSHAAQGSAADGASPDTGPENARTDNTSTENAGAETSQAHGTGGTAAVEKADEPAAGRRLTRKERKASLDDRLAGRA